MLLYGYSVWKVCGKWHDRCENHCCALWMPAKQFGHYAVLFLSLSTWYSIAFYLVKCQIETCFLVISGNAFQAKRNRHRKIEKIEMFESKCCPNNQNVNAFNIFDVVTENISKYTIFYRNVFFRSSYYCALNSWNTTRFNNTCWNGRWKISMEKSLYASGMAQFELSSARATRKAV